MIFFPHPILSVAGGTACMGLFFALIKKKKKVQKVSSELFGLMLLQFLVCLVLDGLPVYFCQSQLMSKQSDSSTISKNLNTTTSQNCSF